MSGPPKYAIMNTCDAPQPNMICQWVDGIGYCYMARFSEPHKKNFDGMQPRNPTPIEDFGFTFMERQYQVDFERHGPSVAIYEDGKHRDWQSKQVRFSLPLIDVSDVMAKRERKMADDED